MCTRDISEGFSEMCVWIGRLDVWARWPSLWSKGEVQEGAKRGVRIGVINIWWGSMVLICAIVASVFAIAFSGDASRMYSGERSESMHTRPMNARWPFWRQMSARRLVESTWMVAK